MQAVTTGAYRAVEYIKKNIKLTGDKASVESSIEVVKIPVERIKVFLETGGKIKKLLESKCSVHLHIEPGEGDIEISGNPTNIFFAGDMIRAIGRGFTPEIALRLLNQDHWIFYK